MKKKKPDCADDAGACDYCKFGWGRLVSYGKWRVCKDCEEKLLRMEIEQCKQMEIF